MQKVETAERDFTLIDHGQSILRLKERMERVGATMQPEEFIRAVSNAYHELEAPRHSVEMHRYFRLSGAHEIFKQALLAAKKMLGKKISILDLGCGAGYDLEVLKEVFSRDGVEKIVCFDISADMQALAKKRAEDYPCKFIISNTRAAIIEGPYDMVVTHAMVHHVADLSAFFNLIRRALVPGGSYVMGHEPNGRYWNNRECMAALQMMRASERRRRNLRKYFKPSRYIYKIARVLGLKSDYSLESRVNQALRERYGFTSELTPLEIHRLVDIHVPDATPGDFKIGFDGFNWEQLRREYLRGFELKWVGTTGYMGETCSPADLPQRWQRINDRLAIKYPLDGSNFTACWVKAEE